jgi:hypothetical protein
LLKDNQEEDIHVSRAAGTLVAAATWCIIVTHRKLEEPICMHAAALVVPSSQDIRAGRIFVIHVWL